MGNERRRILDMLAKGSISVDEAERLLNALAAGDTAGNEPGGTTPVRRRKSPRYLYVQVGPKEDANGDTQRDRVNIRVPIQLIRAGMKFSQLMPAEARERVGEKLGEKGIDIDLDHLKSGDFDELVEALSDFSVNVDDKGEQVRIYCE
ncbi:MAG: SHOCT-like domain-containing protein [Planctomycetota bacterium]